MTVSHYRPAEMFQLDRATCLALLRTQHVGRLVVGGDEAAVVPVNFTAIDEVITFRTQSDGRATRSVPHEVLFEVDMFDTRTRSGWSPSPGATSSRGSCSVRPSR